MSKKQMDEMALAYDFSKGERGKFHRPGAVLSPPVHLEPEVLAFLQATAKARGRARQRPSEERHRAYGDGALARRQPALS